MSNIESSIIVFEITKKFLVFKILSKELYESLSEEIIKNFGSNYVDEKNQSNNFRTGDASLEKDGSNHQLESNEKKKELLITDDLIYEYLSPIVNSFEISKEINYTYEYALFNKNSYIIRFMQCKNFLLLCIQNIKSLKMISDCAKLIYSEYYSAWYCKSIISLIKYKFGICFEEKCFNETNKNEIKSLYSKWTDYHSNDMVYFVEAIELLDVNEDVKIKCLNFMEELINFVSKLDIVLSEFDFMNDNENLDDDEEKNFEFPIENTINKDIISASQEKVKNRELESFFNDISQLNSFLLTYGNKLLYKYQVNQDSNADEMTPIKSFSIDSSSIFMLLLEAANFLDYDYKEESSNSSNNSGNDDFESVSDTPIGIKNNEKNLFDPTHLDDSSISNSLYGTASSEQLKIDSSFLNDLKIPSKIIDESLAEKLDFEQIKNSKIKYKKTNCFLLNSNKSLGFYEVLYLKLCDNLCLIMLKSNQLSKYCELISDFDILIMNFLNLLQRKRLSINTNEQQPTPDQTTTISPSSSLTRNVSPNYQSLSNKSNSPVFKISSKKSYVNLQSTFDDKVDKTFVSFFMNKLIIFFDKLNSLKNEIVERKSKNGKTKENGFLSRAFKARSNSSRSRNSNSNSSFSRYSATSSNQESSLSSSNNSIKLINILQIKINQLTKMKEFKELVSFINNGLNFNNNPNNTESNSSSSFYLETSIQTNTINVNEFLNAFRIIETQINGIQSNLDQLFFEIFLENVLNFNGEISLNNFENYSILTKQNKKTRNLKEESDYHFKSTRLIEKVNELFNRHLYHYTPYMEIKFKRNVAMSFYWHQLSGLIHFIFINRQENVCLLPSIEDSLDYNLTKTKITSAYRKYLPLTLTFLYKNDCTQFQFNDDVLTIVFSYSIWFEDKRANKIPVDFVNINKLYNSYNELLLANSAKTIESSKNLQYQKSLLAKIQNDRDKYNPPGITEKSYYDLIKTLCYPNAPPDSLTCYELICIHSNRLNDSKIKSQNNYLINSLSKISKNQ